MLYDGNKYSANIPSTLLKNLMDLGILEDPYYRLNEFKAKEFSKKPVSFERTFYISKELLNNSNYLIFEGIDTIAKVFINDELILDASDSHRTYKIKIDDYIHLGDNDLKVDIESPYEYLDKHFDEKELFHSFAQADHRFPKIRKTSCNFGWDWGPNIGDMGIFRPVYIESTSVGLIEEFRHKLVFSSLSEVKIECTIKSLVLDSALLRLSLYSPESRLIESKAMPLEETNKVSFNLKNPELWWPNGYGAQPLYEIKVEIISRQDIDIKRYKIGIRDLHIDTSLFEYGRKFHVTINNVVIFLKGSNYIPEDQIYPNTGYDKTKDLLMMAKDSNHNTIRIWGGGLYPDDYFYDLCDELGLLIINDLMFACATYDMNDKLFMENIKAETIDNLRRIRHHASLIVISGNNECETAIGSWNPPRPEENKVSYSYIFLDVLKKIVEEETDILYLSSSPTSEGPSYFYNANSDEAYDVHFWDVWHASREIEYYRTVYPKLMSEAGLQSYPSMNMIRRYANSDELFENSEVMLNHQKDPRNGNKKIHEYISRRYLEPKSFEDLVYISQLSQAEAMKLLAEHLRLNKGRCMGMIYWQLNDCWGGQSWSSIDFSHTPKLLQYYSKEFYAPNILAFKDDELYILSDSINHEKANVVIEKGCFNSSSKELETVEKTTNFDKAVLVKKLNHLKDDEYYRVKLIINNKEVYELYKFANAPKDLPLKNPHLSITKINDTDIMIKADEVAYGIFLESINGDVTFSKNGFTVDKDSSTIVRMSKMVDLSEIRIKSLYEATHTD